MKTTLTAIGLALVLGVGTASAQLELYEDYEVSDTVWNVTTVKIDPNMGEHYMEGLAQTWVKANDIAKELGHIKDYSIFVSELPQSGHFNMVLSVEFESIADLGPSKEKYDAFMEKWSDEMQEKTDEIVKDYPSMRKITGQYLLREVEIK